MSLSHPNMTLAFYLNSKVFIIDSIVFYAHLFTTTTILFATLTGLLLLALYHSTYNTIQYHRFCDCAIKFSLSLRSTFESQITTKSLRHIIISFTQLEVYISSISCIIDPRYFETSGMVWSSIFTSTLALVFVFLNFHFTCFILFIHNQK